MENIFFRQIYLMIKYFFIFFHDHCLFLTTHMPCIEMMHTNYQCFTAYMKQMLLKNGLLQFLAFTCG